MAWVEKFEMKEGRVRLQPTHVVGFVKVSTDLEINPVLQIDTYGSNEREIPGKQSQTIQIGREAAEQLYRMLGATFGFKV